MASPIISSRLYGAFFIGVLVCTALQTYIVHSFGFIWIIALTDGFICSVMLTAACWLINNNLRYYQPGKGSYINLLMWCGALAGICTFGCRWILPVFWSEPVYTNFVSNSLTIRFFTDFLAIGWLAMISIIYYSQIDQKENEKRKSEAEKLARDAELYNLRPATTASFFI